MNRRAKQWTLLTFDLSAIILSSILAYLFLNIYVTLPPRDFWVAVILSSVFYLLLAARFRLYSKINRYISIRETLLHMTAITLAFLLASFLAIPFAETISARFMTLSYIFSSALIIGSRILWRILTEHYQKRLELHQNGKKNEKVRTLIVGAGQGGSLFIRSLKRHDSEIDLVGIVDDEQSKQNLYLYDVPVLGKIGDIPELVSQYDIEQITIAIPSLKTEELERIVEICSKTDAKLNQMPSVEEVVTGKYEVNKFKEIDVVDLLGREEVKLDMKQIGEQLTGKTILVTGAGGSIGSEIARQIIRFSPKRILLLGHGEHSIYLINKELRGYSSDSEIVPLIGDIQDRERMFNVMAEYQPDVVYHAAAHKHVPLMEYNPTEAIKNNIYGTKNVAEAAKKYSVDNFVMISTDKAVNPPNVMGSTKRIAEMIVTGLNEKGKTNFVAVRFGNVLGSRGSVIPLFKEQIRNGGPITVTDFRMTRYFMTIPEASRLVLQAGALAKGGELFVLDMGEPVKIVDLAKKMIRLSGYTEDEIEIVEAGIRPGEKLFEELLTSDEDTHEQVYEKIFIGKVDNQPIEDVMAFVNSLEDLSDEELREALVAFANSKPLKQVEEDIEELEVIEPENEYTNETSGALAAR
ncbi:MAG TPA: nucleoside-diphosphate sugar epimerase/dehydratase [Atopostipes sp.]|nr:nucleoside-diphosphate sugar epimerase/dehydratase [Atopostipes sp.]